MGFFQISQMFIPRRGLNVTERWRLQAKGTMSNNEEFNNEEFNDPSMQPPAKAAKISATGSVRSETSSVHSNASDQSIPLSRVSDNIATSYLWFSTKFLGERTQRLGSFFKVDDVIPMDLLKSAYVSISKAYQSYGFPSTGSNEAGISRALNAVLVDLVTHFRDRKIELPALRLRAEKWLRWKHESRRISGKMDYQLGADSGPTTFFVIEVKNIEFSVVAGLKRAYLYLKRIWEEETQEYLYAVIFNGVDWTLLQYHDRDFILADTLSTAFGAMADRENYMAHQDLWLKDYSMMVKVMYSILRRKLLPETATTSRQPKFRLANSSTGHVPESAF